jgi:hypothetical protein
VFDTIAGLPTHALVIHAVVVLVPLCAVGTLVMAVWPAWRRRLMVPFVVLLTIAFAATFVARQSGEELQQRLAGVRSADLDHHIDLGLQALWVVGAFWVLGVAWFVLDRRQQRLLAAAEPPGPAGGPVVDGGVATQVVDRPRTDRAAVPGAGLVTVVMVLAVLAALFATTWIVLTGDAGARAVWGGVVQSSSR